LPGLDAGCPARPPQVARPPGPAAALRQSPTLRRQSSLTDDLCHRPGRSTHPRFGELPTTSDIPRLDHTRLAIQVANRHFWGTCEQSICRRLTANWSIAADAADSSRILSDQAQTGAFMVNKSLILKESFHV